MTSPLTRLPSHELHALERALAAGRLDAPYTALGVGRYVAAAACEAVCIELQRLTALGMSAAHIRELVLVAAPAPSTTRAALVWSGPEDVGAETRDTAVVLEQMFRAARTSVLVAGFAVHQGREVFRTLAGRMEEVPTLDVRLFLHVARKYRDTTLCAQLVKQFADRFYGREWPGKKAPIVFYDPRTLELDDRKRASLHAKCVVVDREHVFVTSANFTKAAQVRNIEVGVELHDRATAAGLEAQFDRLIAAGELTRLPAPRAS